MNHMENLYGILGVPPNASEKEIRRGYYKETLRWHPDRNKSPDAEGKMKRINAAYKVLSDPVKKREYDWRFGQREHAYAHSTPTRPSATTQDFDTDFYRWMRNEITFSDIIRGYRESTFFIRLREEQDKEADGRRQERSGMQRTIETKAAATIETLRRILGR